MDWVNARARRNHQKATQARFFALGLKSLQIVLAGSIPILALASPSSSKPAVNGILGALIVMIEGFQHTFKFEQFWIHYRQAGYDLQHELTHFELRAGPYEAAINPVALFAVRVADINRGHVLTWAETIQKGLTKNT